MKLLELNGSYSQPIVPVIKKQKKKNKKDSWSNVNDNTDTNMSLDTTMNNMTLRDGILPLLLPLPLLLLNLSQLRLLLQLSPRQQS